ncbi:MAG: ComF family protein [Anaerovibrio sp.]|nr:ComF family protein [Anaerovibrio sp.]
MLDFLLDFLFPPKCPICGGYVERRHSWCPACLANQLQVRRLPLAADMGSVFDGGVWALGSYEGGLRDVLRQLKYDGRKDLLPGLHQFIAAGLAELPVDLGGSGETMLLVPVPLHRDKLRERGFNQSELLFQNPFQALQIAMGRALQRERATVPQFGLTAGQRQENLRSAFALRSDRGVTGRHIILADDIMTTGATLQACGELLRRAGAKHITGLAVASGRK